MAPPLTWTDVVARGDRGSVAAERHGRTDAADRKEVPAMYAPLGPIHGPFLNRTFLNYWTGALPTWVASDPSVTVLGVDSSDPLAPRSVLAWTADVLAGRATWTAPTFRPMAVSPWTAPTVERSVMVGTLRRSAACLSPQQVHGGRVTHRLADGRYVTVGNATDADRSDNAPGAPLGHGHAYFVAVGGGRYVETLSDVPPWSAAAEWAASVNRGEAVTRTGRTVAPRTERRTMVERLSWSIPTATEAASLMASHGHGGRRERRAWHDGRVTVTERRRLMDVTRGGGWRSTVGTTARRVGWDDLTPTVRATLPAGTLAYLLGAAPLSAVRPTKRAVRAAAKRSRRVTLRTAIVPAVRSTRAIRGTMTADPSTVGTHVVTADLPWSLDGSMVGGRYMASMVHVDPSLRDLSHASMTDGRWQARSVVASARACCALCQDTATARAAHRSRVGTVPMVRTATFHGPTRAADLADPRYFVRGTVTWATRSGAAASGATGGTVGQVAATATARAAKTAKTEAKRAADAAAKRAADADRLAKLPTGLRTFVTR